MGLGGFLDRQTTDLEDLADFPGKFGCRSIMQFTTLAEIFITSRSWLAAMVTPLGSPEKRRVDRPGNWECQGCHLTAAAEVAAVIRLNGRDRSRWWWSLLELHEGSIELLDSRHDREIFAEGLGVFLDIAKITFNLIGLGSPNAGELFGLRSLSKRLLDQLSIKSKLILMFLLASGLSTLLTALMGYRSGQINLSNRVLNQVA